MSSVLLIATISMLFAFGAGADDDEMLLVGATTPDQMSLQDHQGDVVDILADTSALNQWGDET